MTYSNLTAYPNLTIVQHPLVQHKLTIMRKEDTSTNQFRRLLREVAMLLGYEVLRDLPLVETTIQTPMSAMQAPVLEGKKLCFVPILRAGLGMVEGMLDLVPSARVGHIGLYRDPDTLTPVEYYAKLPEALEERVCVVIDPMLATGHSAVAAIERLKDFGAKQVKFVSLLSAPAGVECLLAAHPDVPVFTAALDSHLNAHGYIIPGLGDAGDRLFGTK